MDDFRLKSEDYVCKDSGGGMKRFAVSFPQALECTCEGKKKGDILDHALFKYGFIFDRFRKYTQVKDIDIDIRGCINIRLLCITDTLNIWNFKSGLNIFFIKLTSDRFLNGAQNPYYHTFPKGLTEENAQAMLK